VRVFTGHGWSESLWAAKHRAGANADCPFSFGLAMNFDYHFYFAVLAAGGGGSALER
jgi:hypothetical protein